MAVPLLIHYFILEEIIMKISKIFAGMSALAMAATMVVSASADTEIVENAYRNATGTWTYTYTGDQILAACNTTNEKGDGTCAQFGANEDGTYTCGFNVQVGHMKNAVLTMKVTSSTGNVFNGYNEDGSFISGTEDYLWTVQKSWTGDADSDSVKSTIKYTDTEAKGATELNGWVTGSTKFNGQWAQFMLTDDNLSAVTVEVTVTADENTKWECHADSDEADADNTYIVLNMFASPATITEKVDHAVINNQILGITTGDTTGGDTSGSTGDTSGSTGGDTSGSTGGDATTGGDTSGNTGSTGGDATGSSATGSADGSTSKVTTSGSSSNTVTGGTDGSTGTTSNGTSGSGSTGTTSNGTSGNSGSTASGSNGTTGSTGTGSNGTTGSTGTSANGTSTGNGTATGTGTTADNTNTSTGASTGVALAVIALAGAAVVATKKK
jgi:hypothetical protein